MPSSLRGCCAFTGHRPNKFPWKYDEKDERCVALKAVLTRQIEKLAAVGVTNFYTGMALGVDTWAAMAVLDLRERNRAVKLHCVLPCEGQEIKWTIPAQVRYKYILDEADSVEYVRRIYTKDCMLERNQRLVDSADILLAVYNGERRGGTAATVRYAQKANRKIVVIDPITRKVTKGVVSSGTATTKKGHPPPVLPAQMCRNERPTEAEKPRRKVCSTGRETDSPGLGGTPTSASGISKRISSKHCLPTR